MLLPWSVRTRGVFPSTSAVVLASSDLGAVGFRLSAARAPGAAGAAGYDDPGDALVWAFALQGSIVTRAGTVLESSAGHLAVSSMQRMDAFRMTPDYRALSIRIPRDLLPLTAREVDVLSTSLRGIRQGVPNVLAAMAGGALRGGVFGPAASESMQRAVLDLARAHVDDLVGAAGAPDTVRGTLRATAMRHIERFAVDPGLSARAVADAMRVSVRTLHKSFEGSGTTVARQILDVRLRTALQLLGVDPPLAIGGIAHRSGFASSSSLIRAFREAHGATPGEWRRLAPGAAADARIAHPPSPQSAADRTRHDLGSSMEGIAS